MIPLSEKIIDFNNIANLSASIRLKNKTIVHCHGVFDLVHPGHIKHFYSAKKYGDILIVTLTADQYVKRGPGRPIFKQEIRAESLAALAVVDYVVIVPEATAENIIKYIKPNFFAKGPDYKDVSKDVTGQITEDEKNVTSCGGKLIITEDESFSSSKLINNHLDVYPANVREFLQNFSKKYSIDYFTEQFKKIEDMRVLVIGDAIIDEYHYCLPLNKTGKEPLVANKYTWEESFAGGALATANNIGNICRNVDLITVLGRKNTREDFIQSRTSPTVNNIFFYRDDAETTTKRRYISDTHSRKLFEICFMNDNPLSEKLEWDIALKIAETISSYDLVVVNDFGHGFVTPRIIDIICDKSKKLALNVQTNSANTGFNLVTKYRQANCVCIDEMELRYATHDRFSPLSSSITKIYDSLGCDLLLTTRGKFGSLSYSALSGFTETPTFSSTVLDAVGAGDAFFAYISPLYANGVPQDAIAFIGNAVGSLAVQIVGNRETVKKVDVLKFITRLLKH